MHALPFTVVLLNYYLFHALDHEVISVLWKKEKWKEKLLLNFLVSWHAYGKRAKCTFQGATCLVVRKDINNKNFESLGFFIKKGAPCNTNPIVFRDIPWYFAIFINWYSPYFLVPGFHDVFEEINTMHDQGNKYDEYKIKSTFKILCFHPLIACSIEYYLNKWSINVS